MVSNLWVCAVQMGADYPDGGVPSQRKSSAGVFTSSELPYIPTAIFPHGSHKPKIRVSPRVLGAHTHTHVYRLQQGKRDSRVRWGSEPVRESGRGQSPRTSG